MLSTWDKMASPKRLVHPKRQAILALTRLNLNPKPYSRSPRRKLDDAQVAATAPPMASKADRTAAANLGTLAIAIYIYIIYICIYVYIYTYMYIYIYR